MFANAFASIANGVAAMAGGPFVDSLLKWPGTPTLDAGGSITAAGTPVDVECKVQVDSATEAMRLDADFQQKDVRLLILSETAPTEEAHAHVLSGVHAGVYALQSITRDPAGIGYDCRGRRVAGAQS